MMRIGQLVGAFSCAGVSIELLAGALLVRAAVRIANRVLGPATEEASGPVMDWDWDDPESSASRRGGGRAIPKPGYGYAAAIALLVAILKSGMFFGLVLLFDLGGLADVNDGWTRVGIMLSSISFGVITLVPVLAVALPTTALRATLVAFVYHGIGLYVTVSFTCTLITFAEAAS